VLSHRIAGLELVTDAIADWLAPFRDESCPPWEDTGIPLPDRRGAEVANFIGELGDRRTRVSCEALPDGWRVAVDGCSPSFVSRDGAFVERLDDSGGPVDDRELDAMFGPALLLALAARGIFCLHAAAVEGLGRGAAFLGGSGAGKSTLARRLPDLESGLVPLADDVLPTDASAGARPRFPQPRWAPSAQRVSAAENLPLGVVFVLAESEEITVESLSGREAAVALARHTMGARLFDARLAERHFDFCAALITRVRVEKLSYPRSYDALPHVARCVLRELTRDGAA